MERGVFCISIDFELAWGFVDVPQQKGPFIEAIARLERPVVRRLLDLFGKYGISATWAIVGCLLERQTVIRGHPAGPVPPAVWYAPDLLDQIRSVTPAQELASHSFGHLIFSHATREQAAADLDAAARIHRAHGLDFTSFVFPDNKVNHLDVLAQHGIKVFRSGACTERLGGLGRLGRFLDKLLPLAPLTVQPLPHETGLVELPGCMPLIGRNGIRRLIRWQVIVHKARAALAAAAAQKRLFHFYLHPHNLYFDTETQFKLVEAILAAAATLRDQGLLDILPMKSFATLRTG